MEGARDPGNTAGLGPAAGPAGPPGPVGLDVDDATRTRLAALGARGPGAQDARVLRLGALHVGDVGVVAAEVRAVAPVRTYARKRGGEGLLCRVTLADATGEADLLLWDDEVRLTQDGPLRVGAAVRLHGPTVKAGRSGGVELGLGAAHLVPVPPAPLRPLAGRLVAIGATRPVGDPPALRFTCELTVATDAGDVRVAAWDAAVKAALAAGLGARVLVQGRPNPFLEGWWTADALATAPATAAQDPADPAPGPAQP